MNRIVILFFISCFSLSLSGQVFDVDTLQYSGNKDKFINLVVLGDGYVAAELPKFATDAQAFADYFFSWAPFQEYKSYFNVFCIKVPSNQSGASHPGTATDVTEPVFPVSQVDNYFGSAFDSYGIHRLVVAYNTSAITNVLATNFPSYDQVIILVNSPEYGGSGGYYSVATMHSSSGELALHELGHGFAGLHDEYWAGDNYAGEGVNMTKETSISKVRWTNWINTNGVGIYQHCCTTVSASWYRPHQNCKMRYLGTSYCPVCGEHIIEVIHSFVSPVIGWVPSNANIITDINNLDFKVILIKPYPNTLKTNWKLNGITYPHNSDSIKIEQVRLRPGLNALTVTVEDTTENLRVNNHASIHISVVTWTIKNEGIGTGIEITSGSENVTLNIYPNPSDKFINIEIQQESLQELKAEIWDLNGKLQKIFPLNNNSLTTLDLSELYNGIYIIKIYGDNNLITSSKIIKSD